MFEGNPYKRVIPASKSKPCQKAKTEKPTQKQVPTKGKEENEVLYYYPDYRQRALRFLRQGEDERRFPCLLQETGGQEELQVTTRLYTLSYLHARKVYLWGDKRGLV